jgi:hypothetical protein
MNDFFQLQEPLTDGGIRSVNFFNGRLLAGRDLTREQDARREAERRLGQALGDGVANGLEVGADADSSTPQAPVLSVKAGLALNRCGQTLRLASDTRVALTRKLDSASDGNCVFASCLPIGGGTYVAGAGVYLLTLAPAQISEGRAPSNGLDPDKVRCSSDATVEALQFRLLAIKPERFADLDPASPRFRNRLAYRCFGIDARAQAAVDPWRNDPASYGLIDELRASGGALSDYDVPLALLYWTAAGLQFIDAWAVRRRLLGPDALSRFAFSARTRRRVEAEAMCAQFQAQLADLLAANATPAALHVGDHIQYLPPFGLVPLQNGPLRGFGDAAFFAGVPRRPLPGSGQTTPFIDARMIGALREQALTYAPTDVDAQEFIWVYRPWQTVQAMGQNQLVQPLLVFASGLVPDLVLARFDMARVDFSNFAAPDAF